MSLGMVTWPICALWPVGMLWFIAIVVCGVGVIIEDTREWRYQRKAIKLLDGVERRQSR